MKIEMIPVAAMFTFDSKGKSSDKTRFYRALYGFTDASHFGRYKYERSGLLTNVPYLKPTNSTIIVRLEDVIQVRSFFRMWRADFTEHLVVLHAPEAKALGLTYPSRWQKLIRDLKGSPNLLVTVDF